MTKSLKDICKWSSINIVGNWLHELSSHAAKQYTAYDAKRLMRIISMEIYKIVREDRKDRKKGDSDG